MRGKKKGRGGRLTEWSIGIFVWETVEVDVEMDTSAVGV